MSMQNLRDLQAKKAAALAKPVAPVAPTPTPAPAAGGFNFGAARKPGSGKPVTPTPKPVAPKPAPAALKPVPVTELPDEFGLEDLAMLEADGTPPTREPAGQVFHDEIAATAPERSFDAELNQQQLSFVESLDGIYHVLHDAEMFGQSVRIIMMELAENKEYKKLIADQDVHVIIRGMRNTMGLAKIKKQDKQRKNATPKTKAARAKSAVSEDDMALLDSLLGDD